MIIGNGIDGLMSRDMEREVVVEAFELGFEYFKQSFNMVPSKSSMPML
jgi:hypothetical protein